MVDQEELLPAAYALLRSRKIRRLPVVAEGRLVGIATLTDMQKLLFEGGDDNATPCLSNYVVRDVMTANPVTVAPGDAIENAALLMQQNGISTLPVIEKGALVGIITETDIFRAFNTIMGLNQQGTRIVLEVEHGSSGIHSIQAILDAIEMHEVELLSIMTLTSHSKTHSLLTIRVKGFGLDDFSDEIRDSGHRVLEIA